MLQELRGKRAIVTGGATGIGLAIARQFQAAGMRLAIADLNVAAAERAAAELGPDHIGVAIDVRDRASVAAAFDAVTARFGGYDILAANAGVSSMKLVVDLEDADWDFNMDVNARGIFLCNQIVARHFVASGRKGVIVNTASLAGKVGAPLLAHYSASKFAVLGWTQAFAREVAPIGIRVNAVCPGFVRTGMQEREIVWEGELRGMTPEAVRADYVSQTPLGRIEEPEDVARVRVPGGVDVDYDVAERRGENGVDRLEVGDDGPERGEVFALEGHQALGGLVAGGEIDHAAADVLDSHVGIARRNGRGDDGRDFVVAQDDVAVDGVDLLRNGTAETEGRILRRCRRGPEDGDKGGANDE